MEHYELLDRQKKILSYLAQLPRKIVSMHDLENMSEFILYDLCDENCLNLQKAAYFIDNPDFNCTKGVVGYSRQEQYGGPSIWHEPQQFSDFMRQSSFNKRVRSLSRCSIKNIGSAHKELAEEIAHELGFERHGYCSWHMKHGNEGFVIYEKGNNKDVLDEEDMVNGLSLLSFCPIF